MNMDNVINWISNETMRNTVYHNHKENMAWVATALYISGAITLGLYINGSCSFGDKTAVLLVALVVTACAGAFIKWQFDKRRLAAYRVSGLIRAAIDLCRDGSLGWRLKERYRYTYFISKHICSDKPAIEDQWKSETLSYATMGIAFNVFFFLILNGTAMSSYEIAMLLLVDGCLLLYIVSHSLPPFLDYINTKRNKGDKEKRG